MQVAACECRPSGEVWLHVRCVARQECWYLPSRLPTVEFAAWRECPPLCSPRYNSSSAVSAVAFQRNLIIFQTRQSPGDTA